MCFWKPKPIPPPAPVPYNPLEHGYKLTFAEDFVQPIDWDKWTPNYPGEQDQKGLTKFVKECVYQDLQGLHLVARMGDKINLCGQICSWKFLEILYGYIRIRAKIPPKGFLYFFALWLYNRKGWFPELDIIEANGGDSTTVSFTHIWGNDGTYDPEKFYYPDDKNLNHLIYCDIEGLCKEYNWFFKGKEDFSLDFHDYAVDWRPDKITWYIDGFPVWTATANIPNEPIFLVCGIQAGGVEGPFNHLFTPEESGAEGIIKLIEVWQ